MNVKQYIDVCVPPGIDLLAPHEVQALRDQLTKKDASIAELVNALENLCEVSQMSCSSINDGYYFEMVGAILAAKNVIRKYKPKKEGEEC